MSPTPFTKEERKMIGRLAKEPVLEKINHPYASPAAVIERLFKQEIDNYPALLENAATFVEIQKNARLRGCVGSITPNRPLYADVVANSMTAAFKDPRFPPMMSWEIEECCFEISILGDFETDKKITDIELGVHGVYLQRSKLRSMLLPKLAIEFDMSVTEFLDAACIRAGITEGMWDEPETKLTLFKIRDTVLV